MTIQERYLTRDDARRAYRRMPSRVAMGCRRLTRIETDVAVDTDDLSLGGARLRCGGLITGDVVECALDEGNGRLELRGLVVQTRTGPGGPPFVHIAWTNVSPAQVEELGRILNAVEAAEGSAGN